MYHSHVRDNEGSDPPFGHPSPGLEDWERSVMYKKEVELKAPPFLQSVTS